MLQTNKHLHDFGFALHHLHPKSKRPVNSGWTKGARLSWAELKQTHKKGFNIGVRLGAASKIEDGYLAVIDCDVKSDDPKHYAEMKAKLAELFKNASWLKTAPMTASGRGNGSGHMWIRVKTPVAKRRLAQSNEKVKVWLPSGGAPSEADKKALSNSDLVAGYRMRAAWEIDFMSEGCQVVLPPSIHPDTAKPYIWSRKPQYPKSLPLVDFSPDSTAKVSPDLTTSIPKFVPVDVDLEARGVNEKIRNLILQGDDCDDRSAGLFKAAIALVRAGLTDNEILSVLTERGTFLGDCPFDHTKSGRRDVAANWVNKYTLQKARLEYDAAKDFDDVVIEALDDVPLLSEAEAEAQARELIGAPDWRKKIERSGTSEGAKVKNTAKNAVLILTGVFGSDVFIKNDFKHLVLYGRAVPWGRKPGDELSNDDLSLIGLWFADNWRVEPSKDKLLDAIIGIAANNRFHPVRDYLDGLKWDGVPRAENWLKKHLGATGPKEYLASVSLKTLVAMVARIYEPGIKFDCVLILQGRQGVGKSRAVQAIAGDDWFSDAPINLHDKDGVLSMRSTWVMELGELAGMRKSDVDQLKEFLSRRVDRIRPPYGRLMEAYPRQCIFIGTTNNSEYLKDPTGGRRFWPVEVGECDVDGLSAERDQLLAEAKAYYALGENLWLDNDKARAQSEIEQEARMHADEWVNVLAEFFEKDAKSETPLIDVDKFKLCDLFGGMGPLAGERMDVTTQMRVGTCLRQLGYDKADLRINGRVCKVWTRVAPTVAPKSKTGATENVQ